MWSGYQVTKKAALGLYEKKFWEKTTPEQIVKFQLFQKRLCMPFDKFHEAVEKVLNRSVFTHEFAYAENLQEELQGLFPALTLSEVIDLIPVDKRAVMLVESENKKEEV